MLLMKKFSFFVFALLLALPIGCGGKVVYEANPKYPVQMNPQQAFEDIELSLSMLSVSLVKNVRITESGILYEIPTERVAQHVASYDNIELKVSKSADGYYVNFYPSSTISGRYPLPERFTWKFEADARQFVNAVLVLRDPHFRMNGAQRAAPAPTSSPSALKVAGNAKTLEVSPPPREIASPRISITFPADEPGVPVIARASGFTVKGSAESEVGIADVLVNERQAELDEKGRFSSDIRLKMGRNDVMITAIDVRGNRSMKQFVVNREKGVLPRAGSSVAGKKEGGDTPKIVIIAPDASARGISVADKRSSVVIVGSAESRIGIADVLVNGHMAELDEKGRFSSEVLLKIGRNDITVTAMDVAGNQSTKQFVVQREAGKVAAVPAVEPAREEGIGGAQYYALLIAIQNYDNPELSKLDYPMSDANRLRETLIENYSFEKDNVQILSNPDRRMIYKSLQSLRRKLTEKDNLLIFYAGHGTWMDDMRQGFWLPRDAAGPNDPSDWISNSSIRDYIKAIKAKHILLIADACFSGGILKLRAAANPDARSATDKIYQLPSRRALTSGSLKMVPDRSVFADFLIKRLRDNREPYLDTQRLYANMRDAVIHNSPTNQTPLYGVINEAGDEGGDFVFVKR